MEEKKKQLKKRYGISGRTQKKIRRELFDQDYIDKLSNKELDFLDKFNREFNQADFKSSPGKPLHKTKSERKICTDRNNARNRCMYSRAKARDQLESIDDAFNKKTINPEDGLIASMDQLEDNSDNRD
jgi:hypothetical protein